jgi:hypothetical protein
MWFNVQNPVTQTRPRRDKPEATRRTQTSRSVVIGCSHSTTLRTCQRNHGGRRPGADVALRLEGSGRSQLVPRDNRGDGRLGDKVDRAY